jgi:integrase/recombinase XerD
MVFMVTHMGFWAAREDFLSYCAIERQLSPNTIQAYTCDLADFGRWLPNEVRLSSISQETLKAYLKQMVTARKLTAATIHRRMACLRAFFRRVASRGDVPDPFDGWRLQLQKRKRLPRALARQEVRGLLAQFRGFGTGVRGSDQTLRTALWLMVSTGIRVGELCFLKAEDLSFDGSSLRVQGKGSRDRMVFVSDVGFRAELEQISRERRRVAGASSPLFLNSRGSRLRPPSIRSRLRRLGEEAGMGRRITPHMLRHTAATLLIETGVDIRIVQRLLGHASIATTEIYTHVSDETLKTTLERANILAGVAQS